MAAVVRKRAGLYFAREIMEENIAGIYRIILDGS